MKTIDKLVNVCYTATFKNGNAVIKEVPFTVETTSLVEPSVPARQCYSGKWSDYEIIADDITIYAEYTLAHSNIVKVDAKEAQCNATGNIEYWHCSGCNTNYTTQEGTIEAINVTLSKVACEYVNGSCKWCGSSGSPIEDFTFEDAGDSTYILTSYIGEDHTIVIPATYKGRPIKAIATNAFKNCILVESVSLSNSITSIGANAFENCAALTDVVLSNKLTTIGEYAFSGCVSLETIAIPATVTSIGYSAFKNCSSIDNITIPSGVTKLEYQIFYGCTSLENLVLSEGIQKIESYAFQNCSSLKNVIIPGSVTDISVEGIFNGCSSLETLVIPIDGVNVKKSYSTFPPDFYPIPVFFGTTPYENSFEYEYNYYYYYAGWATSTKTTYIPNALEIVYVSTSKHERNGFFENLNTIDVYWDYVYGGVKVDFDYNDGTTESTYKFVESGETYTFDIPIRNGYTFDGWYYNTTQITGANGVTLTAWNINSDCILTAKWTIISYSIGIELNGGSLSTSRDSYTVATDTFTIGEPTKTGYEFLGWSGSDISGNPKTITITKGSVGAKSYTAIHLMNLEWTPIGTKYSFKGVFDGNGHCILGLKVTDSTLKYSGLFGFASEAKFLNVIIKDSYVNNSNGYGAAGLLVGFASSTTSSSLIENCAVEGTVTLYKVGLAGGIVGEMYGTVSKSYANVTVYGSAYQEDGYSWRRVYVGGIAGSAHKIENCWSSGNITATGNDLYTDVSYGGGIAGMAEYISNCYSTANVSSNAQNYSYAGGIVGKAIYSSVSIGNCFSVGDVIGDSRSSYDAYCGRIVAETTDSDEIVNCYADSSQTITKNSTSYGTLQFTHTLQSENFIYNTLGWSSDIWQINEGGFPTLK